MAKQTKWKLALGVFGAPFLASTAAYFFADLSAEAWLEFVKTLVQWVLGLYAVSDVTHKGLLAGLGRGGKQPEEAKE